MTERGYSTVYAGQRDLTNLDGYKYSGVDHSIMARLVLQRYWTWLVQFLPLWLAPNMVTLLGLVAVLFNLATLLYYSPDLAAACPSWVYYTFAAGLFTYTSLDAIDGKQARRTGTSSPLGELFDHGVDALNTTLGCVILVHALNLNQSWALPLFLSVSLTYFFCSTWETYHTHTLHLGYINGPVEGTLIVCLFYLFTAVAGRDVWLLTLRELPALSRAWEALRLDSLFHLDALVLHLFGRDVHTVPLNYFILAIPAVSLSAVVLASISRVFAYYRTPEARQGVAKGGPSWPSAFVDLFPMVSFVALNWLWLWGSPSDIVHTQGILFSLVMGLEFAMIVGRTILAHLLHMRFPRLYPGLLLLLPGALNSCARLLPGHEQGFLTAGQERTYVLVYAAVTTLLYSHFVLTVINQFCAYLDINCLTIKKKTTPKAK